MNERSYDLIVIGGGPSGMMAAGRAAELGARVLLIEKNKTLGKKLLLTGGGRCNITNATFNVRDFLSHFPETKEFLYSPFSKFSAKDTFDFFERRKLPLVVEAHDRAFPSTQKAEDVLKTLETYLYERHVETRKGTRVTSLQTTENGSFIITTHDGAQLKARCVAIATGGSAAPQTGSTGDGFRFLKDLGHTVNEPDPNVVPLVVREQWVHALSGTTLSFMTIRFKQNGKTKLKKTGKILFTHFGVSGPLILNAAFEVKKLLKMGEVEASIDLFPDTEENELDRRVWRLFEKNKNKMFKNVLPEILQENLAEQFLTLPGIVHGDHVVHSITKDERKMIVKRMKDLTFHITGTLGLEHAVIADGGIPLSEIDPRTMTSRLHPNLYLLGDVLDINRPSGGFSLQLCWTTGWVAGEHVGSMVSHTTSDPENPHT